jgi:hypothetical protein
MQIKLVIFLIVGCVSLLSSTIYLALNDSKKEGVIITQKTTISLLKSNVDSLNKALENSKENANIVNLSFDKTKLKGSGNIIIDTKQLQSLACDTLGIIRYYRKLRDKEQRKYR